MSQLVRVPILVLLAAALLHQASDACIAAERIEVEIQAASLSEPPGLQRVYMCSDADSECVDFYSNAHLELEMPGPGRTTTFTLKIPVHAEFSPDDPWRCASRGGPHPTYGTFTLDSAGTLSTSGGESAVLVDDLKKAVSFDLSALRRVELNSATLGEHHRLQTFQVAEMSRYLWRGGVGGEGRFIFHLPKARGCYELGAPRSGFGPSTYGSFLVMADGKLKARGALVKDAEPTLITLDPKQLAKVTVDPSALSDPPQLLSVALAESSSWFAEAHVFHLPPGEFPVVVEGLQHGCRVGTFTVPLVSQNRWEVEGALKQSGGTQNKKISAQPSALAKLSVPPGGGHEVRSSTSRTSGWATTLHLPAGECTYAIRIRSDEDRGSLTE